MIIRCHCFNSIKDENLNLNHKHTKIVPYYTQIKSRNTFFGFEYIISDFNYFKINHIFKKVKIISYIYPTDEKSVKLTINFFLDINLINNFSIRFVIGKYCKTSFKIFVKRFKKFKILRSLVIFLKT